MNVAQYQICWFVSIILPITGIIQSKLFTTKQLLVADGLCLSISESADIPEYHAMSLLRLIVGKIKIIQKEATLQVEMPC